MSTKTIFTLTPFNTWGVTSNLNTIFARHNRGEATVTTDIIVAFLKCNEAMNDNYYKLSFSTDPDTGITTVMDGYKPFLTFEEKELHELDELPEMWEPENNGQIL
jgi:O-acetylhomoserine/O-acetylserine sulfhydrylase-like pyridoxal-dependent enzyme